jgi:hypothetical protein
MDSYTLVNKMRKARRKHALSAGAQGLFQELIALCNEDKWPDIFKCRAGELCNSLNITEKTLTCYRCELILAGLIGYLSGKSKREYSYYSMDGGSFDSSNGVIFCYQSEYQKEYQLVEKTPNNKNKGKRESKIETFQSSNNHQTPEDEKQRMIEHFCNDKNLEKEKSSGKKEIPPTATEADAAFKSFYPSLYELIRKDNPAAATEEMRFAMLELFWAENLDDYHKKVPPWGDIIKHFRNWVPKYAFVKKEQQNSTNNGKITNPSKTNANHSTTGGVRQRTEDKRNQLRNLKDGSSAFLRRADM